MFVQYYDISKFNQEVVGGGGGAALQKVGSACCVIPHLDGLGLTRNNFLSKSLNLDKIQSKITRYTL